MKLLYKLALFLVPINIISVAFIQLELLSRASREVIEKHFNNNTLLVIAHPDDETMFFGPLILNLVEADKHIEILCLSQGESNDLGQQRARELASVAHELGPKVHLTIISDTRLPDEMDSSWDEEIISSYIEKRLIMLGNRPTIVTFDSHGVSGHMNHRSISKALEKFRSRPKDFFDRIYYLESVNIFRKYISLLDALVAYLLQLLFSSHPVGCQHITVGLNFHQSKELRRLLFLHESQMLWFRQLYSLFARYMFINDFILMNE